MDNRMRANRMGWFRRIGWKVPVVVMFAVAMAIPFAERSHASVAGPTPYERYFPVDTDDHWAYFELDNFLNADFLSGYTNHKGQIELRPNQSVTRAEFVAILVRVLGLSSPAKGTIFADVKPQEWYYDPIRIASAAGIVSGTSPTTFAPNARITRGDMTIMIVRAFKDMLSFGHTPRAFVDVPPDYYARPDILKASTIGLALGDEQMNFRPLANASRAEAIVMISRALEEERVTHSNDAALASLRAYNAEVFYTINNRNFGYAKQLVNKHFTGFQRAYGLREIDDFKEMTEEGYSIKFERVTPRQFRLMESTSRVAAVEAYGGTYKLTIGDGADQWSEILSDDGIYLVRKMPDGSWKPYSFYED